MASANSFDLTGRVALVTGGNGGIGRSIALAFARAGASVAILGRNEKKNQAALADLKTLGGPTMAIRVDIAKRAELEPAFQQVEKTLGPVGILVNNAGTVAFNPALQQSPEEWDHVIETNLTAAFLLSKIAGRSMVERRAGKIINIASMYSFFGSAIVPSYSAAYQIHGHRACAAQYPSERDRTGLVRYGADRTGEEHATLSGSDRPNPGRPLGASG